MYRFGSFHTVADVFSVDRVLYVGPIGIRLQGQNMLCSKGFAALQNHLDLMRAESDIEWSR
jgi:hypothetical protein